jgi:hypothetical protein
LALALHTSGFFSSLEGGAFVGARSGTSAIWGVGLNFASSSLGSMSGIGLSIAPGAKLVCLSAADGRVELVVDLGVGYSKYYLTDHRSTTITDGYGLFAQAGPGLRLWLNSSLALGYSALFSVLHRGGRRPYLLDDEPAYSSSDPNSWGPANRAESELTTGFSGRLSLLGVF